MSVLPYHKRYHSDALAGFMPLTLEERGTYQTLLDMIYDRGGPLIDNERLLAGYMNCSVRKWRQLRQQLIEKGKIQIDRDGLVVAVDFDASCLVRTRQPLLKSIRVFILDRDGEVCRYCGAPDGPFEIDHIVPVARGGLDHLDNLAVACRSCNRSKGALLIEEWLH